MVKYKDLDILINNLEYPTCETDNEIVKRVRGIIGKRVIRVSIFRKQNLVVFTDMVNGDVVTKHIIGE